MEDAVSAPAQAGSTPREPNRIRPAALARAFARGYGSLPRRPGGRNKGSRLAPGGMIYAASAASKPYLWRDFAYPALGMRLARDRQQGGFPGAGVNAHCATQRCRRVPEPLRQPPATLRESRSSCLEAVGSLEHKNWVAASGIVASKLPRQHRCHRGARGCGDGHMAHETLKRRGSFRSRKLPASGV